MSRSSVAVWPHNRAALDAFLAAATQWRTSPARTDDGRIRTMFVGLDYQGVAVALGARGTTLDAELLAAIQTIELAARHVLNGGDA